ncbi:MAG: helix-turn-helix domain-containing protein, partial [Ghiorsea sp.]|nr:helix-turn-helix domain-containing protein [Ghiorsea sp.]
GRFREDLFYRLNVIPVHMPSLRQRREDIPVLVQALMQRSGGSNVHISDACMQKLSSLPLAGNVRELENTLQRLLALSDDDALDIHLLDELQHNNQTQAISLHHLQEQGISLDAQLEHIEKSLVEEALIQTQNNATQAAKLLGISFRSMRYRMQKLGLKEEK